MPWEVRLCVDSRGVALGMSKAVRAFLDHREIPFAYVKVEEIGPAQAASPARESIA